LDAERERDVLTIDIEKQLLEKEGEQKRNAIQNQIIKDREQNLANITAYAKEKAAEAINYFSQMNMSNWKWLDHSPIIRNFILVAKQVLLVVY